MRKLAPAALTATVSLLLLAGCSAGGQSVAEACSIAEEKVTAAQGDLNDAMSSATSGDTEATSSAIESFTGVLDDAASEITNEEVKDVVTELRDQFETVGSSIEEVSSIDTSDPDNIDQLTELQEEMTTLGQDLTTTGTELQELCNG